MGDRPRRRFRWRLLIPGLALLAAAALVLVVPALAGPHDRQTVECSSLAGLAFGAAGLTFIHFAMPATSEPARVIHPSERR